MRTKMLSKCAASEGNPELVQPNGTPVQNEGRRNGFGNEASSLVALCRNADSGRPGTNKGTSKMQEVKTVGLQRSVTQ
jgi:hypothetical protein